MAWSQRAAMLLFVTLGGATLVLAQALLQHDFALAYVAQVGSRTAPAWVKFVSLWAATPGAWLVWTMFLAGWTALTAYPPSPARGQLLAGSLLVLHVTCGCFVLLGATAANPFLSAVPVPLDGGGANPLLQNHVFMALHPPLMYLGLTGTCVPFAMVLATRGAHAATPGWQRQLRALTLVAWTPLSAGLLTGIWWSYQAFGLAGGWNWDPVENAALLPWLAMTMLLHTLRVAERTGKPTHGMTALAAAGFLLTLLSLVITHGDLSAASLHRFTPSAFSGVLGIMLAVYGLASVAWLGGGGRPAAVVTERPPQSLWSRARATGLGQVALVALGAAVLLGMAYPWWAKLQSGDLLGVAAPYFTGVARPLTGLAVVALGAAAALPWGRVRAQAVLPLLLVALLAGIATAVYVGATHAANFWTCGLAGAAVFAALLLISEWVVPALSSSGAFRQGPLLERVLLFVRQRRRLGATLAHLAALGLVVALAFGGERRNLVAALDKGQSAAMGDLVVTFVETTARQDAQRLSVGVELQVDAGRGASRVLRPRLNFYPGRQDPISTPDSGRLDREHLHAALLRIETDGSRAVVELSRASTFWVQVWALPLLLAGVLLLMWPTRWLPRRWQSPTLPEAHP